MEYEEEKKNQVLKYLELIDISSEDDFLIASPFYDSLEDLRLSVKLENINELFGTANSPESDNAAEVLHQRKQLLPSEFTDPKRPSFLRKSLAWDSEFFTSAGVLDPEELCFINKGFSTAAAHLLPEIQEDVRMRRSDDSECSYDSDGFYLESLDGDPFEDIRVSIDKINKTSSMNCESGFGQAGIQKFRSSKKVDVGYPNRVKSTPASKRQSIKPQGSGRLKRESHTARSGESNIQSLKPQKVSGRVSARQTKRTSLGTCNVKSGSKTTKPGSGQDLTVSKRNGPMNLNSLSTSSSTTPPPKSCSKLSLTASKGSTFSCSSYDISPSSSSSKHSFSSTRRKLDSRSNKQASPGFSIHLSVTSNHSSSTSPCCSIDGLSFESYSSSPISNHRYNYMEPCLDSHLQSSTCQEIKEKRSTRNLRPSGLRMPSPKIGFFDEKSVLPEVRGNVNFHFGVQNVPVNNDLATNTKRLVKLQSAKTLRESGNIKQGSVQSASRIRPKNTTQLQDSKGHDLSPAMDRESCWKIWKVGSGEHDKRRVGGPSSSKAEEIRMKETLKNSMIIKSKGKKDDTGIQSEAINSSKKRNDKAGSQHLERNPNLHPENEKEKLSNVEDEVSSLSRCFEVIDIRRDLAKELRGKSSNSHGKNGVNGPENGDQQEDSLNILSNKPSSPLFLSTSIGFKPSTRTPLADKTTVCNRNVSVGFWKESSEKSAERR
ncbi:hypothetical protein LguiA_023604 [Lonicera macranthoides]